MASIEIINGGDEAARYIIIEGPLSATSVLGPFTIGAKAVQAYTPGTDVKQFVILGAGGEQAGTVGKDKRIVLAPVSDSTSTPLVETKTEAKAEAKRPSTAGKGKRAGVPDPACSACPQPFVDPIPLGNAYKYAVLSATAVVGTGAASTISPTVTGQEADAGADLGFAGILPVVTPPGTLVTGAAVVPAVASAAAASAAIAALPTTGSPGVALGGLTLGPGVYRNNPGPAGFSLAPGTTLTLDAGGNPNAVFVFDARTSPVVLGAGASIVLTNCARADNVFWRTTSLLLPATLNTGSTFIGTLIASGAIQVNAATVTGRLLGLLVTLTGASNIQLPAATTVVTINNTCVSGQPYNFALAATPTVSVAAGTVPGGTQVSVAVPPGSPLVFTSGSFTFNINPSLVAGDQLITFTSVGGVCTPALASTFSLTNNCPMEQPFSVTVDGKVVLSCTLGAAGTPTAGTSIPIPTGATSASVTGGTPSTTVSFDPATSPSLVLTPGPDDTCVFAAANGTFASVTNNCTGEQTVTVTACGLTVVMDLLPGDTLTAPVPPGCVIQYTLAGGNTILTTATTVTLETVGGVCMLVASGATVLVVSGCSVPTVADISITSGGVTSTTTVTIPSGGTYQITGLLPGDVVVVTANGVPATATVPSTGPAPSIAILSGTCTPILTVGPSGPAARVCCSKIIVQPIVVKKACPPKHPRVW